MLAISTFRYLTAEKSLSVFFPSSTKVRQDSRLRQPLICAGQEVDHNVEKLQCDLREARAELARLQKVVTVNQVAMTQSQQALYKAEITTQQLMRAVNMMVGKSKRLSRAYI